MSGSAGPHEVIVPPAVHGCRPPMMSRTVHLPSMGLGSGTPSGEPSPPTTYDVHPPVGSVWECGCGLHWRVEPPRRYANLVSFMPYWERCSARAYRKAFKRGRPTPADGEAS